MCWISFIAGALVASIVVPLLGVALFAISLYFEQKEFIK